MPLLAEKSRRKKKWSVDPQGKRWSKDNDKIGQKMLEKMGWTSGKGLGVNEQGIIEHVTVNKRNSENEKAGIGYDEKLDMKDLHKHQDKFNDFLQQLAKQHSQDECVENSGNSKEDLKEQSLELKSKHSHAQMHYQKFTRGKDVSKYNSKDLANIFGRKESSNKTEVNMKENNSTYESEAVGTIDNWSNIVTINSGCISDYFKQKLSYQKKDSPNNTINNEATDSESESKQRAGFGFIPKTENTLFTNGIPKNFDEKNIYAFDNPCLGLNSPMEITVNADNSSKKSKRKRKKEFVSENADLHIDETNEVDVGKKLKIDIINSNCENGFTNPALNLNTKLSENCNGKEFEVSRAQFGLENCALDLTDEKSDKKRVTFNDHVEYSIDTTKRKKGKATLDRFEVENKKHTKKRKRKSVTTLSNGFVNEALDVEILFAETNDNELNEYKSTKIKKRKIRKTSNLETIQESPEREKEIIETDLENATLNTNPAEKKIDIVDKISEKKKKKKKKVKNTDNNIADVESEGTDIIKKIIRKKHKLDNKKREVICEKYSKEERKDEEADKTVSNGILENLETEQQQTGHSVKIKNKKSKKQEIIKDTEKVATSLDVTTLKEESMPLEKENTVQKKKKRNNQVYLEDEFNKLSNKENTVEVQESNIKFSKKNKKHNRSKDALDTENSISPNVELTDANISSQENVNNVEFIDTPSRKSQVIDSASNLCSPWNKKARMTKKMLKKFFYGNLIADFPGSNIQEIKGYGIDSN